MFLFVIFVLSTVLYAQEVQNEPVTAQDEPVAAQNEPASDQNEPAAAQTEIKNDLPAAVEETPASENQKSEAADETATAETVPETVYAVQEEKPAESGKKMDRNEYQPQQAFAHKGTVKKEFYQPEESKECECEPPVQNEKPSKMFYQPSVGIGIGASIFSLRVNNDFDFLLKHTKDGTNVYAGLEIDFRYSPYLDEHSIYEIPIQMNMMLDFMVRHRNIKRLALWFSAGVDLAFGYLFYYDYDDGEWDNGKDRDSLFKVMAAWGFGVNMLFHNDVTLKLGFDSFYGKYPDIICAAGYRF